jgi:MSHA biogenesis protein MshO
MNAHRPFLRPHHRRGFTLVEVVIVMVVTGILAGIVAIFIRAPVLNYINSRARAELSDTADTALRRIRRDVRLALPNSVRVTTDQRSLEFILTKTGARYLSADDGQSTRNILNFVVANLSFDIVGTPPSGAQAIVGGEKIVVYNLGPGFTPADAYSGGNVATVNYVSGQTVTLLANPFAVQSPAMESPSRRFQVISGPVTYYCNSFALGGDGTIRRYSGYPLTASQVSPPTGGSYTILASNVQGCQFTYDTLVNEPKALAGLTLVLRDPRDTALTTSLAFQVHVDNTP